MIINKFSFFIVFIGLFIFSGCSINNIDENGNVISHIKPSYIKIVKPYVVSKIEQTELINLNQNLSNSQLSNFEKAKLLYERSCLYEKMGLNLLSFLSLVNSSNYFVNFAPVYDIFGMYATRENKYLDAYEAFDATLDLDPKWYSAYLNRGIALYYGKRFIASKKDLETYYNENNQDPYRILWLYIINSAINKENALNELEQHYKNINTPYSEWIVSLIEVILDKRSEQDFWDHIFDGVHDDSELPERLCEAYFYLGKYHQINDEKIMALDYFKLSMNTNVMYYIEYQFSEKELQIFTKENNKETSIIVSDVNKNKEDK
ncbi:MAG: hypothetical protein ACI4V7_01340 [Succinivibrionaceae bacterium]